MFFNSFLSFFDNKGRYNFVSCKFFRHFFTPTHYISRTNGEKVTPKPYIFSLGSLVEKIRGEMTYYWKKFIIFNSNYLHSAENY